jgi:superfamily II DNA/RNA helicase
MKFEELEIDPLLKETTSKLGFEELTPIQEECIPKILEGKDVVGQAETGSGKTVAFALPILNRVYPDKGLQVLALTPTRELCVQVGDVFKQFGDSMGLKTLCVYGGVSINPQIDGLKDANIVVGTPGRILDHIQRKTINLFDDMQFIVLDEADRMFDMGFIEDVEDIISYTPKDIQTAMFSATISDDIYWIMERHLRDPVVIKTKDEVDPGLLKQTCYDIYEQRDKFSILIHLLKNRGGKLALVFCGTRHETEFVARNLRNQGIKSSAIHGNMSQAKRLESLEKLKRGSIDVLVATDVAARGLDIKNVTHVYNYDVPGSAKEYVHRIGRTARAGEEGDAITLLTPRDHDNYRNINMDYGHNIEMKQVPDFEKIQMLPRGRDERGKGRSSWGNSQRNGGSRGRERSGGPRRDRGRK